MNVSAAHPYNHMHTQTNSFTQEYNKTTKAADQGHDTLPSPPFI